MVTKSAAAHTHRELTFAGANHAEQVATFTAPSSSRRGTVNTVSYCWATNEAACDCTAAVEYNRECWHVQHVAAAYWAGMAWEVVRRFGESDADLLAVGQRARAQVDRWEALGFVADVACPLDAAVLRAARCEYKRRERAAGEVARLLAAFPPELIRTSHPCPDCGERTHGDYLCRECMADLEALRAGEAVAA